jgi:FtsH-binding integral membrane protein
MYYAPGRAIEARAEAVTDALWKTYRWMSLGLATTGAVALAVASSRTALELILGNRILFFVLLLAQLGVVVSFGAAARRASTAVVAGMFFAYAALTGVTFSTLFLVYTSASIGGVFVITAGAFAALSAVGWFTKKDLGVVGRFALFALFGLILASLVNFFLASPALYWLVSAVGVLVFGALTAYDTQKLKAMFAAGDASGNLPLVGALMLYLDFVNMFLFLLRLFGRERR